MTPSPLRLAPITRSRSPTTIPYLVDGTDDRDDEDSSQTAIVYDELSNVETSGQVQPRERIELDDGGGNIHIMWTVYIASSNSYYYIFEDPPPSLDVEYTVTAVTTPNSVAYSALSTEGIVCFMRGTRINVPGGTERVERIRPGDMVMTLDHGPRPVCDVQQRIVSRAEMLAHRGKRAFRVEPGALGPGMPSAPLYLSRQHRVVIRVDHGNEMLAPVHALARPGIVEEVIPPLGAVFCHLQFEDHEIVTAEGAACESLYLGEQAQKITDQRFRPGQKIIRPARPILQNQAARKLAASGAPFGSASPSPAGADVSGQA